MSAPHATHPTPEDLAAFAAGTLPQARAGGVAAHLESCPDCRRSADSRSGTRLHGGAPATSAAPPNLPPELANHPRYRILRELGRGGMGVVYQARQTVMDRQVVIKVINKALLDQPGALERFQREVRAAAKLSHPNIVTAYDAEQAGELHMLVMEFVPGQSLAEVLQKKGPLPVPQACSFIRQAALGLQHALERGMVHRDIKPQNLMLTPKVQVKILDFGLAKLASERGAGAGLTAANAYMGTPDYSAPEQATDARKADIRADIYSLGCTLYCLLAGRPPFHEETDVKTILAHLQKEPPPLADLRSDVPAGLGAVVARMLAKDPGERYQKPVEVAQALLPFAKAGANLAPAAPSLASATRKTAVAGDTAGSKTARQVAAAVDATPAVAPKAAPKPRTSPTRSAPAAASSRTWLALGGAAAAVVVLGLGVLVAGAIALGRRGAVEPDNGASAIAQLASERQRATGPVRPQATTPDRPSWLPSGPADNKSPEQPPVPVETPAEPTPARPDKPGDPPGGTGSIIIPPPPAETDPIKARLDKAREAYEADYEKLRKEMLDSFQEKEDAARKDGNKKVVDQVKTEREAFENRNQLPRVVPSAPYEQGLKKAVVAMETAYEAAIKEYTRANEDAKGRSVEEELKQFKKDSTPRPKAPVVVATYAYEVRNPKGVLASRATHKLYSNGHVDAPNSPATWQAKGNVIVFRWPDPKAPGGAWEDVCTGSNSGASFVGKNQAGWIIDGVRLNKGEADKKP
jgi:tRNA A-37 threonylcarbamoyl transferase component Bud32